MLGIFMKTCFKLIKILSYFDKKVSSALNLKDFNIGGRTNMEDNASQQKPKLRWTKLLKPIFKTKASKTKTRWAILLK